MNKVHAPNELQWISFLLRLAVGTLFGIIGVAQVQTTADTLTSVYAEGFYGSILPESLVIGFLGLLPYVELLLAVWLIVGVFQKWAWVLSGFLLIALSMGLLMLNETQAAADNFLFLLLVVAGLYFSRRHPPVG